MPFFVFEQELTDCDKQAVDDALVRKQKLERLIEESRSAKVVSTAHGNALLIGGQVIHVIGEDPELLVEAISIALRQRRVGGLAGQDYTPANSADVINAAEEKYRQSVAEAGYGNLGICDCLVCQGRR